MKYDRKEIMKKAWEIKKENEKNIFGLCLKMAWAIAKKAAEAKELPELQGSVKQVAWAKDIRDKFVKKFSRENLFSEVGYRLVDSMEKILGINVTLADCMFGMDKETKHQQMEREFKETHVLPDRALRKENRNLYYEKMRVYKAARKEMENNYALWLLSEFNHIYKNEMASFWIDNRAWV